MRQFPTLSLKEKKGKFKSLTDFINRVDPKDANKLQLEGLVKAGAFDELDKNRKKLFDSIPKIIQMIKKNLRIELGNSLIFLKNWEIMKMRTLNLTPKSFWSKKELLAEEFKSLGFYISDHPLNEYKEFFNELDIDTYKDFINSNKSEALIAGTIMSIQEKKSSKGTPFAILKFSDNKSEFELFLFSELLINNRDKLKESNSFVLTLQR